MAFAQFLAMATVWGVELNEAEVTTLKNIVEKDDGAGAQPAKANDKIGEKSKITTAAASMAELTFADSSITRMGANTLFSFQSKERLIKLNQGTLLIHTPPGNGGATVDCGGVTAAVTGTTFMATRDKVGNSVFVLLEGSGGMKITVGGTTTTIRAGQAASVGAVAANDASGKSEDKATGGTPADASGGGKDKDGGAKSSEKGSGDNGGGGGTKGGGENSGPGGGTAAGDKGGGDAGGGSKSPAASPSPAPASSKPPEIKVFDVDVRKIVQTTPLITEFKAPLPSVAKIEATIAVQQAKVEEGKVERLGVEVVAVSSGDGDLLVGAPMVAKEDMQIVNSKETVAEKVESKMAENAPGKEPGAGGLDISTAGAPPPPAMDKAPGGLDIATAAGGDMPAPAPQGASASSMGAGSKPPLPPPPPVAVVINTAVQEIGRNNPPPKVDLFLAGITGPSKIYDGNRNFSLVGAFLTGGILNGVSLANVPAVQFATKDVGVNIPLSVSVTLTGANAGNYTLNLPEDLNGTITARSISVTAEAKTRVYGEADAGLTYTVGGLGLVNGDNLSGGLSRAAGVNVGKYAIGQGTLDAGNNYAVTYTGADYEITKAPLAVNAKSQTVTYNGTSFSGGNGVTFSGFVLGEDASVLSGVATYSGSSQGAKNAGTYAIQAGGLSSGNYQFTYNPGTLTINKAALTVTALNQNKTYDGLVFGAGYTLGFAGFVGGENDSVLDKSGLTFGGSSQGAIDAGTYTITANGLVSGNYDFNYGSGTLTIGKAAQNLVLPASLLGSLETGAGGISAQVSGNVKPATYSIVDSLGNTLTDGRATIDGSGTLSLGKILGANDFTLRVDVAGDKNYEAGRVEKQITIAAPSVQALTAVNPARRMLMSTVVGDELTALDQFFYYTGKVVGAQGPATFYQTDHENTVLDLNSLGSSVQLYPGQTANYYFGSRVQASQPLVSLNIGAKDVTLYGKGISIGGAAVNPVASSVRLDGPADVAIPDGNMVGVARSIPGTQVGALPYAVRLNLAIDPYSGADAFLGDYVAYLRHTSADGLDSRAVKLFEHIGATTENPDGSAATGMSVLMSDWASTSIASQDSTGKLLGTYRPGVAGQSLTLNDLGAFDASGTWTLWLGDTSGGGAGLLTNWSVELEQLLQPTTEINLLAGVGKTVTMVAGSEGLAVNSSWIKANQANLSFLSTGSLEMRGTQIEGAGTEFLAEAVGKVKMGAQSTEAVPSPSTATADREQVRILADAGTDAGGVQVASPGSMAIIRTGDSLELRNVTIRNFEGTKLEKVQNGVTTGRVLMSGSMVRDFKIKELVGAAVNADAKIQMMAIDGKGALAGEMTVEGSLPVATKLASALAVANETLPSETANTQVHASEIQLSADRVNFLNANVAAMNAITARANTILVQNSFMTVVRNSGMINMYVQSGLVNQTWGSVVAGQVNFAGLSNFRIGNVVNFSIANSSDIANAMSTGQLQQVSTPQAGKVNVLKL